MAGGLEARIRVTRGPLTLDVDLAVADGETVAVLGPNGAGKTTLLHAVAGLVPIAAGSVAIAGRVVDNGRHRVPPERRDVGLVPQGGVLFPHLNAVDNVAFGLRARRARSGAARAQAREWLDRLGVAHRADARPHQLSGGEAQRVALARALACRPAVLLLDEPLSALDATTRVVVRRELRSHLDRFPGPRILVTHDVVEAGRLADRLVVLEEGRITHTGTPAEVAARPRTPFAADLAGVNLLTGSLDGGVVRLAGGGHLVVAAPGAAAPSGEVVVVIHPRAVALHAHRPEGAARNVWPAPVAAVDPEGDRVRVVLGGPVPLVAEVTAAGAADLTAAPGSQLWVAVKATEINVTPA